MLNSTCLFQVNFVLRLGVISLVYLIIAIVLWIMFGFIYERFVGDAIGDFIDFCSMSNIRFLKIFLLSINLDFKGNF